MNIIDSTQQTQRVNVSDANATRSQSNSLSFQDIMSELTKLNYSWRDALQNMSVEQRKHISDTQTLAIEQQVEINQKNKKAAIIGGAFGIVGGIVSLGVMAAPTVKNFNDKHLSKYSLNSDLSLKPKLFNNENRADINAALKNTKHDNLGLLGDTGKEAFETFQSNLQRELDLIKPTKSQGMRRSQAQLDLDRENDKARVRNIVSKEWADLEENLVCSIPCEKGNNKYHTSESVREFDGVFTSLSNEIETVVDKAQKNIFRGKGASPTSMALAQVVPQFGNAIGGVWAAAIEMEAKSESVQLGRTEALEALLKEDGQRLTEGAQETSRQARDVLRALVDLYARITDSVH